MLMKFIDYNNLVYNYWHLRSFFLVMYIFGFGKYYNKHSKLTIFYFLNNLITLMIFIFNAQAFQTFDEMNFSSVNLSNLTSYRLIWIFILLVTVQILYYISFLNFKIYFFEKKKLCSNYKNSNFYLRSFLPYFLKMVCVICSDQF